MRFGAPGGAAERLADAAEAGWSRGSAPRARPATSDADLRSAPVLPSIAASLAGLDVKGEALDASTRTSFEARLGHDFSNVRIHRDGEAAATATALGARAFSYGQHVVFGPSAGSPPSPRGQALLAHELTHVAAYGNQAQPVLHRSRLLNFVDTDPLHDPSRLTDAQIEATNEFRSFMNPSLVWQATDHVTRPEALLSCRLILRHLREGGHVNWETQARTYMNLARAQLGTLTTATALVGSLDWVPFSSGTAATDPSLLDSEFGRWLLAGGAEPSATTGRMNCWELVMFSAFRGGHATMARLQTMYTDASAQVTAGTIASFGDLFETRFRAGNVYTYDPATPATPRPLAGDVVVFTDARTHAAVATGTRDGAGRVEVISHWPPPDGDHHTKRTTIEQLLAAMPPGKTVRFWSVRW